MRLGWVWRAGGAIPGNVTLSRRLLSTQAQPQHAQLARTRNIGIIAHIDAGKTTTTERMLYYSGYTRRIGDVDEGSTVTDFLPAERARGITIQSAAITFHWPPINAQQAQTPVEDLPQSFDTTPRSAFSHNINLIDTPGHADFTFEVLRSLRVLDGAVCILDGVAGVEAQTEKVWTQAGHHQIPRIVFVNKLDRMGAAFSRTVKEIGVRLHGWPAVCQIPWWKGGNGDFIGVGDAVHLRGLLWQGASDGSQVQAFHLEDLHQKDPSFADEVKRARTALVELLSEHDDGMVELFLEHDEDHLAIPGSQLVQSLRRVVLQTPQAIIPVFAGASFRNIGVQPLLDAVVDLLPTPLERPDPEISLENRTSSLSQLLSSTSASRAPVPKAKNARVVSTVKSVNSPEVKNIQALALAFKVVNDARRGILVYVRVYSGSLDRNAVLYNTNLHNAERAQRLFKMYANDAVEVESITTGQIGVIPGLKHARTGDTLLVYKGLSVKGTPSGGLDTLQLKPIDVPPPVFFTSIEPNSLSEQKHVLDSLNILLREDPSLHLSVDEESGQTHLAGMGDLHLEIARDRLLNDFKAKARIGKIEIGYRETLTTSTTPCTYTLDRAIAGKPTKATVVASLMPADDVPPTEQNAEDEFVTKYTLPDSNTLIITHPLLSRLSSKPSSLLPPSLSLPTLLTSLHAGVSAALARGPLHSYPVFNTHVALTLDPETAVFPESTPSAFAMAARSAVQKALREANDKNRNAMMEPVMRVTVFVNEASLGSVVQDLSSSRGGQVLSLSGSDDVDSSVSNGDGVEVLRVDPNLTYTPPDPFASTSGSGSGSGSGDVGEIGQRQIVARVPLKEMVGYLNQLRALTGGRGTFVMSVDGFEKMGSQRVKEVMEGMGEFV
ncbi:P-loop containing nucleoside triphosphate hydrolase protein [Lophiostoma macrostomum CBS 122681]|uniref:Ribosome-releasing factor 2, mitochondrial n=1 Tax=Lophiostoma macrostomum CBS 122681 TaxID=1314788 RepID=A0A6A6TB36_9PLEO|nr:P-loop containing nucleoside triphosphate hydrolase protein [Lophiostoma macrostomum CBS 122681]